MLAMWMLKILQARLQQNINWEHPEVQAGLRKRKGIRAQIASLHWIIGKATKFQKIPSTSTSQSILKGFECVDHNKLWNIFKEMGTPDHLNCLLRNLYTGQEATVTTGYGTMDWFKIGRGVHQGWILSSYLFIYAEYITWNAGLEDSQAGIKIAGRNINNLRYANTIL